MSSLTPLSVPKFPTKQERKERVVAGPPTLARLRPVEPSPSCTLAASGRAQAERGGASPGN